MGHIYQVMPFENALAVMKLTGAQVTQLLKINFEGGTSRIQVSRDLSLTIDKRKSDGLFALDTLKVKYRGEEIDEDKVYTVAMNSYMSSGGSCCRMLAELPHKDTAIPLRVLFMETIKKKNKRVKQMIP